MLRTLVPIALLFGLFTSTPGSTQDCQGTANQLVLTCAPQACPPGCGKMSVDTPWGPNTGEVCVCNYIGPQPFCCKVMRNTTIGAIGHWGECASPGCPPTPGLCVTWAIGGGDYQERCINVGDRDPETPGD